MCQVFTGRCTLSRRHRLIAVVSRQKGVAPKLLHLDRDERHKAQISPGCRFDGSRHFSLCLRSDPQLSDAAGTGGGTVQEEKGVSGGASQQIGMHYIGYLGRTAPHHHPRRCLSRGYPRDGRIVSEFGPPGSPDETLGAFLGWLLSQECASSLAGQPATCAVPPCGI